MKNAKTSKKKSAKKGIIVWGSVSGGIALLLAAIMIVTHLSMIYPFVCTVLGGQRPVFAEGAQTIYEVDQYDKDLTLQAANALNERMVEEGIVLLRNEDNALPLQKGAKISVFGQNSINIAYGGSGSGGAGNSESTVDLYQALSDAGFEINPVLKKFYETSGYKRSQNSSDLDSGDSVYLSMGEAPQSAYTAEVKDSYAFYADAAIVVITRIGGEGFDLPRSMKGQTGARNEDDHYLQLDQNETDLIQAVCESGFQKVIVVVNSAAAMELAFLEDPDYYAYQENIDAALWIGFPGDSGLNALARVISGEVNPSGRTVDTYVKDLKKDPTWYNFGDNRTAGGDAYLQNGNASLYYFVDYEENIYVGYKYYETRGVTDGEDWYQEAVVYPFGYGLSYTTFDWELVDASSIDHAAITKDGQYTVQVKVTNTGSVAGKDVVQLYGHAPYFVGEIEKPEETLLDFAKTKLLAPGESEIVTLNFDPYYLASYDYSDANANGFKGYELDASDAYALYVSRNAHDRAFTIPFTSENIQFATSMVNEDVAVTNLYTDCDNPYFNSDYGLTTLLSRSDWEGTMPTTPTAAEREMSADLLAAFKDVEPNNPNDYSDEEMPWDDEDVTVTFRDMLTNPDTGVFGKADYDDARWETLLDSCTFDELIDLYDNGNFKSNGVLKIGKPLTNDTDGPSGFTNFMSQDGTYWGTCHYCAEVVMAATWNTALMEELGEMVGCEGVIGAFGKGNGLPYSGWYAPGVNIHRSAFGGRNFEYFSEDGILNGRMAAAEIRGCQSKGVYCFVKHFALNEQETHRSITGLVTWATEQAIREIYLRPFELAVKEGGTRAVMSSFNRIGTRWTGGDYRLLTQILREEWGFRGMVICDFNTIPQYMNSRQMAYAGGDLNLATQPESWCDTSDVSDVIILRQAAKNVFYTVANSNAMNAEIVGYERPIWEIALFAVTCVAAAVIAIWGCFVFRRYSREKKQLAA